MSRDFRSSTLSGGLSQTGAEDEGKMSDRSGGDAVVDGLKQAGVDVVFGIPSVHNPPIYDAIRRDGRIRAITVWHEQGASGAADGYARTTGRLGVCITSTGPGAANVMGGQFEAYISSSPVLHLTGQIDSRFLDQGRGFIHEVPDQPSMLASLSKANFRTASTNSIGAVVAAAAFEAMACRRGPVSLEIPIDLQYAPCSTEPGTVPLACAAAVGLVEAEVAHAVEIIVGGPGDPLCGQAVAS